MTLRHIVVWKLATQDAAERAEQVERIAHDLRALRDVVPEILDLSIGPDVLGGATADIGLVADFADVDALQAYQVHPAHQVIVGYLRPLVSGRMSVDFEV
jgi:hypothetical protein